LLEQTLVEKKTSVIWATARALAPLDHATPIQEWLNSTDARRRRAACRLAARRAIRSRLEDTDDKVATAAGEALKSLEDAAIAEELVEAVQSEPDSAHRWALLDALVGIADLGDEGVAWPSWARRVAPGLPLAMRDRLRKALQERCKEVVRAAEWKDR
jgi:hypothetical protein